MSGTNPVATYTAPNNTTQNASAYKGNLDAAAAVFQRLADSFAPRQTGTPAMTVSLDAGHVFTGTTLTEVASQVTGTITAPVSNPRIDRVVVDCITGAVSTVTGTPAGSPTAPAVPAGKTPVARVLLQTTSTVITNSMITDERDFSGVGRPTASQVSIASASTTDIGSTKSSNVKVTGTTGVSSFGSTAGVDYGPVTVTFAGALVLTNSGALALPTSANITTAANDSCVAVPLGSGNWQVVSYSRSSGASLVSGAAIQSDFKNLAVDWASNTTVTLTADQLVLQTAGGVPFKATSVSVTIDITASGANGLDTGSVNPSTPYYIYVIYNGTTVAGVFSASSSGPTLPGGYTYATGWMSGDFTDGSSHLLGFHQRNRRWEYAVGSNLSGTPLMSSGATGNPSTGSYTAVALGNYVLTAIACSVRGYLTHGSNTGNLSILAPNNNYGAEGSTTNAPPVSVNDAASSTGTASPYDFLLQGTNLYVASTGGSYLYCSGFDINI